MIAGIGTDIVETARIRKMIEDYGDAFLKRIFTPAELREAATRQEPWTYYAGRWAVKEALSKALGCGIGEKCSWQDIETLSEESGKPATELSGCARNTAVNAGVESIHVSISHEQHYACASIVLEGAGN